MARAVLIHTIYTVVCGCVARADTCAVSSCCLINQKPKTKLVFCVTQHTTAIPKPRGYTIYVYRSQERQLNDWVHELFVISTLGCSYVWISFVFIALHWISDLLSLWSKAKSVHEKLGKKQHIGSLIARRKYKNWLIFRGPHASHSR